MKCWRWTRRAGRALVALLLLLGLAATDLRPATLFAQAPHELGDTDGPGAWARVLEAHVDYQGRIDFAGLAAAPARLERHVHWLASHGPATSPADYVTRDAILAHHLNAYNANAMLTVLRSGADGSLSLWRRIRVFVLAPIRIDGSWTSLYSYENRVIRSVGEPRVHFALNCMVKGCPELPRVPFSAELLETQLDRAAREFVRDRHNVRVDAPNGAVWLSSIFAFYTEDFLQERGSLIAYINQFRDVGETIPNALAIRFFLYDWTVNRQDAD